MQPSNFVEHQIAQRLGSVPESGIRELFVLVGSRLTHYSSSAGFPSALKALPWTRCRNPARLLFLQDWLKQAAKNAVASVNTPNGKAAADDWACVRSEAFMSTENEYAYLPVSEFSDSTHTLPPDEEAAGAPVPAFPAEMQGPVDGAGAVPAGALPAELDGQNPLMLFLRSLMPWADLGLDPQQPGGENGDRVQLNEEQLEQVQLQLQREAYEQAQAEAERRGWARG